jgi:hypothetical protein
MKILVKKMSSFGILKFQLIAGAIVMLAVMVLIPVSIISVDASLILNPFVLFVVVIGMLMFGLFAYFLFTRPYFIYHKSPEVLMETDGEYVYIYGKNTEKIPLSAFERAMVTYHLPFIYSKELIATLLTHLFSDNYGDLSVDVPEYGSFKLRFVANVCVAADELTAYLCNAQNQTCL